MLLVFPVWVYVSFFLAQQIVIGAVWLTVSIKIPLVSYNQAVLNTLFAVIIYLITLTIVFGVPYIIKKRRPTAGDIGITRLPIWTDIFLTPAGLIVYFILSSALILLATSILPWFDANQVQDTGFRQLNGTGEYFLAFTALIVIAPIAEEILFRGYLYGKLKKYVPVWIAIIATSVLFGLIHGAWNLAIDTFALSIVLCLLRESTGSIWPSILLHMAKNSIAFYFLFINPALITALGG